MRVITATRYGIGIFAALLLLIGAAGCVEHEPEETITFEIENVESDDDAEYVKEQIKEIANEIEGDSSRQVTTIRIGDEMTMEISPLHDVEAIARKIEFGKATVDGRTVSVELANHALHLDLGPIDVSVRENDTTGRE